jgi:hypothetical protein
MAKNKVSISMKKMPKVKAISMKASKIKMTAGKIGTISSFGKKIKIPKIPKMKSLKK